MNCFSGVSKIKLVIFTFIFLALQPLLPASENKSYTAENAYFEIIGGDLNSVNYINNLSAFTAEIIQRELSDTFNDPPRKVLVRLRTFDDINDYTCPISDTGHITLNFDWTHSLRLEQAIEGLTLAFIQSYCFSNFGTRYLNQTIYKEWCIRSLSTLVEMRLRPRLEAPLLSRASNALSEDFFLTSFIEKKNTRVKKLSKASALLFWKTIKSEGFNAEERRTLLLNAFNGVNILPILNRAYKTRLNDSSFDFLNRYTNLSQTPVETSLRHYESLEKSHDWLKEMTELHVGDSEKAMSLHQIWEKRDDARIKTLIEARLQMISLVIIRINPVYYNALQSLALVYQTILDGENEWDMYLYLSDYLKEEDRAQSIHQAIQSHFQSK